jgi:hypothetical protein
MLSMVAVAQTLTIVENSNRRVTADTTVLP